MCVRNVNARYSFTYHYGRVISCTCINSKVPIAGEQFLEKPMGLSTDKSKPFGYMHALGSHGNLGMTYFSQQNEYYQHSYLFGKRGKHSLNLGFKFWYISLGGNHFLGLNLTFTTFSLARVDKEYFPLGKFYQPNTDRDGMSSFSVCTLEFVYVDFYRSDFSESYLHSLGPFCGHLPTFSLFSSGNAKIYFRTFLDSPSSFAMYYQAIDLGYAITKSIYFENAIWLKGAVERNEPGVFFPSTTLNLKSEDINVIYKPDLNTR